MRIGILNQAVKVKEQSEYARAKEEIQLAITSSYLNDEYKFDENMLKQELIKIGATYNNDFSIIKHNGYVFSYNKNTGLEENVQNIKLDFKNFPSLKYDVYSQNTDLDNFYINSIIAEKENNVTTTYYVDKINGLDSNNGLSSETAFKTLKKALTAYTTVKSGTVEIIVIGETTFYSDELYGELLAKVPLIIKPLNESNRIVLNGGIQGISWDKLDDGSNIYKCSTSVQVNGVINTTNKDDYGLYTGLTQAFSLSDCKDKENSFYIDSSDYLTAYINIGNEQPNENILPVQKGYLFRFNHTTSTNECGVYLKNIDTIGVSVYAAARSSTSSNNNDIEFIAENCIFQHGFSGNLLQISNYDIVYMVNCIGGYAYQDIFNYAGNYLPKSRKDNSAICEINCKLKEGGFYNKNNSGNNNLSTAHDGINTIRLNTIGYNSEGPLVADVNGCRSILIGCNVNNYKENLLGKNCYQFNNVSAEKEGLVTLVNCKGNDIRNSAVIIKSECKTELVNFNEIENIDISDYTIKKILDVLK